jgi:hypothetical protein
MPLRARHLLPVAACLAGAAVAVPAADAKPHVCGRAVIEQKLIAAGKVVLYKPGYKVGIARHDSRSFDILQPHYGPNDPNCCPRSFREQRFTWTGSRFTAGAVKKLQSAPRRFYKR